METAAAPDTQSQVKQKTLLPAVFSYEDRKNGVAKKFIQSFFHMLLQKNPNLTFLPTQYLQLCIEGASENKPHLTDVAGSDAEKERFL